MLIIFDVLINLLMQDEIELIKALYIKHFGKEPLAIFALPPSGSYRKYYRLKTDDKSFIGVYNNDLKENTAFIAFTKNFLKSGLNVPEIIDEDLSKNVYLLSDLGDASLLSFVQSDTSDLNEISLNLYKKSVEQLVLFQTFGAKEIDFTLGYPRQAFDKQSMLWDLNYFKYYFLKLAKVPFDEQNLENDFQTFSEYLLQADCNYFIYRDFQSRNIMVLNDTPYFIDYQGGRKGALQYDIASILFEAKTSLNADTRQLLLDHYLNALAKQIPVNRDKFFQFYYGYVYIRLMQALGAYGFRGLYEKKELFLQSIPNALKHLKWLRENIKLDVKLPELEKIWDSLYNSTYIVAIASNSLKLNLSINSFSYRKGIPIDETGNGGGFVFDCRALNNPGRLIEYQQYTGQDEKVIQFLKDDENVIKFLNNIYSIIDISIANYSDRKMKTLMVNFGCTGGQHRSVYCSEELAKYIRHKFPKVLVSLNHRELPIKNSL
jgi:aminoglycoside/choline kinase family phosphotransferase